MCCCPKKPQDFSTLVTPIKHPKRDKPSVYQQTSPRTAWTEQDDIQILYNSLICALENQNPETAKSLAAQLAAITPNDSRSQKFIIYAALFIDYCVHSKFIGRGRNIHTPTFLEEHPPVQWDNLLANEPSVLTP